MSIRSLWRWRRFARGGVRMCVIFCDEDRVTKGGLIGLFEQQSTTLRAYLYHRSVLRFGSSSEERCNGSTIAFAQTSAVATSGKCRVSGNPHPAPYFSSCAPQLGYFAQILATGATGATRYRADCDHSGRVLGSILFLSCFHSQAMPSATVSKAFRRLVSPFAVTLILFLLACNAFAQTTVESSEKSSPKKASQIPSKPSPQRPAEGGIATLEADQQRQLGKTFYADGHVDVRYQNYRIRADHAEYK